MNGISGTSSDTQPPVVLLLVPVAPVASAHLTN